MTQSLVKVIFWAQPWFIKNYKNWIQIDLKFGKALSSHISASMLEFLNVSFHLKFYFLVKITIRCILYTYIGSYVRLLISKHSIIRINTLIFINLRITPMYIIYNLTCYCNSKLIHIWFVKINKLINKLGYGAKPGQTELDPSFNRTVLHPNCLWIGSFGVSLTMLVRWRLMEI